MQQKIMQPCFFAGVGFAHAENYDYPLTKKDPYAINFQGLQAI